jgi:predicted RNase H-like nuclease
MDCLVLGIDAAWTTRNPSGIALLEVAAGHELELFRVARTCTEYTTDREIGSSDWLSIPTLGRTLSVSEILDTTIRHAGKLPDVIALDIPLSPLPICGRRQADNAVSSKYSSQWAGTHTPSAERVGSLSATLFQQLSSSGYYWMNATEHVQLNGQKRYFLETYPHPVIIEMLGLERRLCYKVAKRRKYWPSLTPDERWRNVVSELDRLYSALALRIDGFADRVPKACAILDAAPKSKSVVFKGIEDILDAVVCALVGCEFLAGHALALGDQHSAIWIPLYG